MAILVDLPFDTDLNDKCGNSWTTSGNVNIINNIDAANAAYFSNRSYMKSNNLYSVSSMEYFSISFDIYNSATSTYNQGIVNIGQVIEIFKRERSLTKIVFCYRSAKATINQSSTTLIEYDCSTNIWHTILINYENSTFYIYINNNLILEQKIESLNDNIECITLGALVDREGDNGWSFDSGYIKNFKFYSNENPSQQDSNEHSSNNNALFINFPFDNNFNDKCNNISWSISGNIDLKNVSNLNNNNTNFITAAYFNDRSYIKSNENFQLSAFSSFTISFYIYNTTTASQNQGICDFGKALLVYKKQSSSGNISIGYRSKLSSMSSSALKLIDYQCKKNTWYNIIIGYSDFTFYIYVNNELILEKNVDSLNSSDKYPIVLAAMAGREGESGWSFDSGYIKDFKFYTKNILIEQEIEENLINITERKLNNNIIYKNSITKINNINYILYSNTIKNFIKNKQILNTNIKRIIKNNYKQINYKSFEFM